MDDRHNVVTKFYRTTGARSPGLFSSTSGILGSRIGPHDTPGYLTGSGRIRCTIESVYRATAPDLTERAGVVNPSGAATGGSRPSIVSFWPVAGAGPLVARSPPGDPCRLACPSSRGGSISSARGGVRSKVKVKRASIRSWRKENVILCRGDPPICVLPPRRSE